MLITRAGPIRAGGIRPRFSVGARARLLVWTRVFIRSSLVRGYQARVRRTVVRHGKQELYTVQRRPRVRSCSKELCKALGGVQTPPPRWGGERVCG